MVRDKDVWTLNHSQLENRAQQDTDYAVTILESTAQKDGDRGKRTIDRARTRDLQYTLSWSFAMSHRSQLQLRILRSPLPFVPVGPKWSVDSGTPATAVQRAIVDKGFAAGTDGSWLKLHERVYCKVGFGFEPGRWSFSSVAILLSSGF